MAAQTRPEAGPHSETAHSETAHRETAHRETAHRETAHRAPDICHTEVVGPGTADSAGFIPSSYHYRRQRFRDLLSSGEAIVAMVRGEAAT
jgi:hypothetical protein